MEEVEIEIVVEEKSNSSFGTQARNTIHQQERRSITQACTVAPAQHLDSCWIQLSVLDRFILPIFIPVFFIYDSVPTSAFDELLSSLQSSLAQVLVPYFPYAGRLQISDSSTRTWDVHFDNQGAEFHVVHAQEEFSKTCYTKPCLQLRLLCPKLDAVPQPGRPVPALSVQVTRFRCGTVAIGCSFHHQVGDAYAVSMFMRAWSRLATGKELDMQPVHDRSSILTTSVSNIPPPPAIVGTEPESAAAAAAEEIEEDEAEEQDDFMDAALEGYIFDSQAIAKLKQMSPGSTSFEAITAFVVRAAVRATPAGADQLAKFALMVDFRKRLGALDYAGNAALPTAVIVPRQRFLSGDLSVAAGAVHGALQAADMSYYGAFVQHAGRGPPSKERAMAVSSCARVALYDDADFGYGVPAFSGILPPVPRLVPEFLLFLPSPTADGFVVYLQLHASALRAVDADDEFMGIAKKYRPALHARM